MNISRILILSVLFIAVFIGVASAGQHDKIIPSNILDFLDTDKTDENEYTMFYTCGHFSRDLSKNAMQNDIKIGSAIVWNHPVFKGYQNHIINYIEINEMLYFIEPQTDEIMLLDEIFMQYRYVRLYPDGTQVPSYWAGNLAPTLRSDAEAVYDAL